jgi:hypothetical protein
MENFDHRLGLGSRLEALPHFAGGMNSCRPRIYLPTIQPSVYCEAIQR